MFESEPKLPDGIKKVYAPWDFMVKVSRFLRREYVALKVVGITGFELTFQ